MDFSATSPSSYSSDSSHKTDEYLRDAASPGIISSDLGLDPSDPLNLLLHNTSQSGNSSVESSKTGCTPDWSQVTTLWPPHDRYLDGMKYPDMGMEFNLSLSMDMDYSSTMAVEPSALHFESTYAQPTFFTSNGTLLSENPADELAQRVRQSAGVLLAVPTGIHGKPFQRPTQTQSKLPIPRLSRPKLAPKVKRAPVRSEPSSTASSPPASDSHTSSPDLRLNVDTVMPSSAPSLDPATGVVGRPKTSHTTIERRYRTNLNARIQSLRQAVPALRVLEDKGKPRKDGDGTPVDVVDDRGFVDGVKVARKCSKANVLGKAVEYIRVLKKREGRLIREQNGLKSLISGLVGGPALLKEWEREWRASFGGEEADEVETEPPSDSDEGDDEGDDGFNEEDGRPKKKVKVVKTIKKQKKVVAAPATIQAALAMARTDIPTGVPNSVVPEKRKRGRPRKLPPPSSGPEVIYTIHGPQPKIAPTSVASDEQTTQHLVTTNPGQASQYLLATFALFSFFNSPLTYSPPSSNPHTHTGIVLGHSHAHAVPTPVDAGYGWRELIQGFHLFVSALVLFSIVATWLPAAFKNRWLVSALLSPFSSLFLPDAEKSGTSLRRPLPPTTTLSGNQAVAFDRSMLIDALDASCRGTPGEADKLRSALGISTGLVGLLQGIFRTGKTGDFEQKGLEQRAWVRLGELAVLDRATPFVSRLQAYWCMRSHITWFTASPSDLTTLALIIWRLSSSKAGELWSRANKAQLVRPYEKLVLDCLSVDEAAERLMNRSTADSEKLNPIAVLASTLVRERVKKHAAILFVRTILPDKQPGRGTSDEVEADLVENEEDKRATIDAAVSMGGRTAELGEMLERVWKTGACTLEDVDSCFAGDDYEGAEDEYDSLEAEIKSLLKAVILYRRIFPTSIMSCSNTSSGVSILLSPPPSPSRKNAKLHLALRRTLGSSVFDFTDLTADGGGGVGQTQPEQDSCEKLGIALEDARDRVVDMLVDLERQGRGCSKGDTSVVTQG